MTGDPGRTLVVEADGGSRGNPGIAGYGAVVYDEATGEVLAEAADGIGTATNNVAEYRGLIAGLTAASRIAPDATVQVRMDSKLVVEQMTGHWRIKHPDLVPLARQAEQLARGFASIGFTWIPRARNKYADRLANEAMDAATHGRRWQPAGERRLEPAVPAPTGSPGTGTAAGSAPGDAAATHPARAAQKPADTSEASVSTGWSAPTRPPTGMLLLRHGATSLSARRAFAGRGDFPLTDDGLAQAEAAGRRLRRWAAEQRDIAAVVSSPLRRTTQTARVVARACGCPIAFDDGLMETDFGDWEGLTFAEARERDPQRLTAWLADPDVAPPGGESFTAVARRVEAARERLLDSYPGRAVVVVSHVTPIKTLLRLALLAPPAALYRMHLDVAALSWIDWYPDGPTTVRTMNDTAHLHHEPATS